MTDDAEPEEGLGTSRDLPRSPSGRIPQWVMDEAQTNTLSSTPWSGNAPKRQPRRLSRRPFRGSRLVFGIAIAVVMSVGVSYLLNYSPVRRLLYPLLSSDVPPPGLEETLSPVKVTPPADGAGKFKFLNLTDSSQPVTFSPCRPIHYVVGRHLQPLNAHVLRQQGIGAVSAATGLKFIYDGDTDEQTSNSRSDYQPDRYGDRWAPVLITWADSKEVPDFGTDVLGEAGPIIESLSSGEEAYVSGQVTLSTSAFAEIASQRDQVDQLGIVEHELGHLVGLDHISDTEQIMYPSLNRDSHDYQSGDLAGLAALGQGPCQPNL